ncbi:MAG: bifunctional hydroxymethylpyrimidine kinase/phosphomethylpyrimidine kinase, partial [Alphaproteobacteria bacterium]
MPIPIALTIAGSDSSGGAGIQADLKTFSALHVYGASVITALTAQNTREVRAIHEVPADFVRAQLDAVFADLEIRAVKIGMLARADIASVVADFLASECESPVVLDPVMVSESGSALLEQGAEKVLREKLFPLADLLTPNLHEAARLLDSPLAASEEEMRAQAFSLMETGPRAVLLTGGHMPGDQAVDILCDGTSYLRLPARRIGTRNTHGTGCTLSAAVAAFLAHGASMRDAVSRAKAYLGEALAHADALQVG